MATRRIPVLTPDHNRIVIVVDKEGSIDHMDEDGMGVEYITRGDIIAIEECPEGVEPVALLGWKP